MLKSLILFALVLNIAFAKDRFSEADKKQFLGDVKQGVAEHKLGNKGKVDLQIIKPAFYEELENYLKLEKFTRDEMLKIKQDYENFSRRSIPPAKTEEEFYTFIQRELDDINQTPLEKIKEGYICNNWSCSEGLKCAPDPIQGAIGERKKAGTACTDNSQCASDDCVEEKAGSKNKVCEEVYRCFRPLSIGQSCSRNPVCGSGSCLAFSSLTSGIGECEVQGKVCKKNSDCCTNLCDGGACKPNYICKDCVGNGDRPQRGQKCCEGLYMNEKGVCVPDVPPVVIPQVRVSPAKAMVIALSSFFISTANAQTVAAPTDTVIAPAPAAPKATSDNASTTKLMKDEINADRSKYEYFQAKSEVGETVDMAKAKANMIFEKKSDFRTCDMRFKEDFYNSMKIDGIFDLEVAMLGFDFVATGDAENDYWTSKGTNPESSLHARLKKIGTDHRAVRAGNNKQINEINKRLTCVCLDVQGYKAITDAEKKSFFETQCEEYGKYTDPNISADDLEGDASGLKAKRLLVSWTSNMSAFHKTLATQNDAAFRELLAVSNWVNEAKWNETRTKNYDLFKFSVKNENSSVAVLGGLVGALLAAGVIAILGGFATSSILSTWAAAGIIAGSSITGAGGMWMIASLKGAWITLRPEISDYVVAPRGYSCGKKESCTEYTRTLVQPYNEICKVHTSANACIKSFVAVQEASGISYIVDPWVPNGVAKGKILANPPTYAEMLDQGFRRARETMVTRAPIASGGGGKKGGGEFIAQSYLSEVFVDADILAKYATGGQYSEESFMMDEGRVRLIKEAAKTFAIQEGFLGENDTENLNSFANYAYEYHFLWPKKSRPGEISYPTVGLSTYLAYMSSSVAGNLTAGLVNATKTLSKLNEEYTKDLLKNLQLFAEAPTNAKDPIKKNLIGNEIGKVQKDLDNLLSLNAMLANQGLDSKLTTLSGSSLNDKNNLSGIGSSLSGLDQSFLKAVGNLRSVRKDQLKALDGYNKAMAGDKERATKVASAAKKFSDRFAKGNSALGSGSGSLFAGSSSLGSAEASSENANDLEKGSESKKYNSGLDDYGAAGTGALFGSGRGGSYNSGSASGSGSYSASAQAENSNLAEAIEARNKSNNKYQSSEGQTLFEKVTNAYIRNYDKVLTKRKDKDVIEDNK